MKAYKFLFLSVISIFFFWSCTVSHVNETLIIGTWTNGKIKSFIVNKKFAEDTTFTVSNKLRLGLDPAHITANEKTSLQEFKNGVKASGSFKPGSIMSNVKTEMNFKPDKTVTLLYRKGKIDGTWKMNSKGNKIIVKDTVTKEKLTINIAEINPSKLIIYEPVPIGDLMITFSK